MGEECPGDNLRYLDVAGTFATRFANSLTATRRKLFDFNSMISPYYAAPAVLSPQLQSVGGWVLSTPSR